MRVELAENDPEGRVLALAEEDAAALNAVRLIDVQPYGADTWRLVPRRNQVGAVRVGNLDLVVRPKASFSSLLFMLGYAQDPGFLPSEVDGLDDDDLWPAVGETLARLAERALWHGVLQGYVTRDESLTVLRGRMRVADQVARRPGVLLPLEVTFDEYEPGIAENRILLTALQRMTLVPRLPARLRGRLVQMTARLDGVTPLVPGAPLPVWVSSRMNMRYQPALRVAELVLRSVGLSTSAGGAPVASFAVDMAGVFEDFVTTALREELVNISPSGRTTGQYKTWLDEESRLRIRPDVVHLVDRQPRLVFDAKYKLGYDDGGYPNADIYQVLAYCTALGLTRGYLVYAGSRAEGARATGHRVLNAGVEVVAWPLDVGAPPGVLIDQINALALAGYEAGTLGCAMTDMSATEA